MNEKDDQIAHFGIVPKCHSAPIYEFAMDRLGGMLNYYYRQAA